MKFKPIAIGNIIVFPCPQAREAMKAAAQESWAARLEVGERHLANAEALARNLPEPSYNDIQKIIENTMRSQRTTKRSIHALRKLRAIFLDKA